MKILWLAPIPLIDASDTHPAPWIITLANALTEQGNTLTIVNNNSNIKEDIFETQYQNIRLVYIKTPKLKLDFLTLYKLKVNIVKKYLESIVDDYDLLHIHGTEHQYEAMSEGLHIPKVVSIQGIMYEYVKYVPIKRYKQFLEWHLSAYYESKYIVKNHNYSCRTEWDSNYIKSKVSNPKIFMIWEMIREEFFIDNFSLEKKNILFVGGNNPLKGLKELLSAYNDSLQDLGLKLIILGKCSIKDIKVIILSQDLQNIDLQNIDCRGMQNAKGMIEAYKESYCLVHPTYIDNSPNSVCEAQISGLPVIATDVGGVSSLIDDGHTGLLIGLDSKDIEHAVKLLINDDILRNNISTNSREIARKRHNPSRILKETISTYETIIKEFN